MIAECAECGVAVPRVFVCHSCGYRSCSRCAVYDEACEVYHRECVQRLRAKFEADRRCD